MATSTQYANESDLTTKKNEKVKITVNKTDRVANQALKVIHEWQQFLNDKLLENDKITERLSQTHRVSDRNRNDQFPSYILEIVRFKLLRRMQIPSFRLEADNVSDDEEALVTDGVAQTMDEGGWRQFLTGKWGVLEKMATYGDSFGRVGTFRHDMKDSEKEARKLVTFMNCQISKVAFDKFATKVRNPGGEGEANECCLRFVFDWDVAVDMYPEIAKVCKPGLLPTQANFLAGDYDQLSAEQQTAIQTNQIELCFYNAKRKRIFALMAGSTNEKIFQFDGADYPWAFWDNQETYLPVTHFGCFRKPFGMYYSGICTLFYNIDLVWQELMNRGAAYILDNVDPLKIINLPVGQRNDFYQKIEMAVAMEENGGRPIVINEVDSNTPLNQAIGQVQTLSAPALTQEFERLVQQLKVMSGYLGIKLDDLLGERGKPLGTTELELENQDETVRAIWDNNTDELIFCVRLAMDAIARDVKDNDDTQVSSSYKVMVEEGGKPKLDLNGRPVENKVRATLGAVAQSLRKNRYRVIFNTASGMAKSNTLELAQIARELADPNIDMRYRKWLSNRRAHLSGFNPPNDDVAAPNPLQNAQAVGTPEAANGVLV